MALYQQHKAFFKLTSTMMSFVLNDANDVVIDIELQHIGLLIASGRSFFSRARIQNPLVGTIISTMSGTQYCNRIG